MAKKPTKKTRKKPPVKRIEYEYDPAWDVEPMELPEGQTLYSCNFKTAKEVAAEKKANRDTLLAQMAATIAAGMFETNPAIQGHHAHHDHDRLTVARMAVDTARQILKKLEDDDEAR